MVGSPLLSYLDVRLLSFLPRGLTSREAKHLGPWLVRNDSLEPIQDGSRDTVFQGRSGHIPVEAPPLGDPDEEGPTTEETDPALPDPVIEMVKKRLMALNRWFPATLTLRGPTSFESTP